MSLIKPTLPPILGPTFSATVEAGGLPWQRQQTGAPATAWLPSDITGVAEWWRADLGVTDAGGGAVSAWQGQIAGETLSQGTAAARPTLTTRDSQSVLSFDGGDLVRGTFGTIAPTQPTFLLAVFEATSAAGTQVIVDGSTSAQHALYLSLGLYRVFAGTALSTGVAADTGMHVIAGGFAGASSSAYLDNLTAPATGNAGAANPVGLTVGNQFNNVAPFTGYIWEVILVDAAISAGDLALLGAYLDARYAGLTLTY